MSTFTTHSFQLEDSGRLDPAPSRSLAGYRARIWGALLTITLFCVFAGSALAAANLPSLDDDDEDYYLDAAVPNVADPLEGWNRAMFSFNDTLIDYVLRPVNRGYVYVVPDKIRGGISNFNHNLLFPVRFINNILQGKGQAAGVEMARFIVNTTAGFGGFANVAKDLKPVVPVDDEDLGQTFGVWGVGEGFYLVWPLLGPSTARDTVGMVGDWFLDPYTYLEPWELNWGLSAFRTFNDLDSVLDMYDDMRKLAIEPYTAVRNGYVQYRRAKIMK